MRAGFSGKRNKVYYYSSDEEEDRRVTLFRENVCFLKGSSGAQFSKQ
jgi:hypothetical protein